MLLREDVLQEIRKRAALKGLAYQTYIQQVLFEHVFGSQEEEKIRKIVRDELSKTG
jgi:hypothetical protein